MEPGVVCWLLALLPGLLSLVTQWYIQSSFTLTVVGRPVLYLYAASVTGSVGWLLELLSCSVRGVNLQLSCGDTDTEMDALPADGSDEVETAQSSSAPQHGCRHSADAESESGGGSDSS